MPPLTPTEIAALLTAAGAFITALRGVERAKRATEHIARELSPNHGSSTFDRIGDIARRLTEVTRDIGGLRADVRAVRSDLSGLTEAVNDDRDAVRRRLDRLERKK